MMRISQERRAHLRSLKTRFDAACRELDTAASPSSPEYQAVNEMYKDWHRAIGSDVMALLDDMDDLDVGRGEVIGILHPISPAPPSTALDPDIVGHFQAAQDLLHVRDDIERSEEDAFVLGDEVMERR